MSEPLYSIKRREGVDPSADLSELLHNSGLLEHFEFNQIPLPVLYLRDTITAHIVEHGLSSLYHFSIVMEDIISRSLDIDEIEILIAKFIARLDGAKRILIIDPYFYAPSHTTDVAVIFKNLISHAISALEEIIFVTNGQNVGAKADIHAAVAALVPACKIVDVVTSDFHDRFWIDPDRNNGLVMGTSLNGLGRKVALIDRLNDTDVAEIVDLAKIAGAPL